MNPISPNQNPNSPAESEKTGQDFVSTKRKPFVSSAVRWFLVVWFILTLPVVALLTINEYSRFILLEMTSHYVSKLHGLNYAFIGDSITAGGRNWGLRLSGNPFAAMNFGVSGYTVHQVGLLVPTALATHPHWVFILAGTNDLLDGKPDRTRMLGDYQAMLTALKQAHAQPVVTLTPQTAAGDHVNEINAFNAALTQLCATQGVPVVDLNPIIAPDGKLLPQYTIDGVHFSEATYQIWTKKLKSVIANRQS